VNPPSHKAFELASPVSPSDHSLGRADAPVIVVGYGDFECPHCKQAAPAVKMMLARFPGQVHFVYRHFPVEASHRHALEAAEAAEFAHGHGKFWEMHDLLYDNQQHLQRKDLREYAASLGLDLVMFDRQMDEHAFLPTVRSQYDSGQKSGVRSTPGFFINNKIHDVSIGLRSLIDAVDKQIQGR
jgi:protein-disulfide isomerase